MIDFRLYRFAFIPAVVAFVLMMFSLQGVPEAPRPQTAPVTFDADAASDEVREVLNAGADRVPGSDGDKTAATVVAEHFEDVEAGTTATQDFEDEIDGRSAQLRNVILTLPGESERTIVVMAARDSASGPGAASSAAATAALIQIGELLGGSEHAKTIVLASTDAGTHGAEGARQFVESLPDPDLIDAAVVIAQPGAAKPEGPHVLRHSTDDSGTSMQLVRIAEDAVSERAMAEPEARGVFGDLARLAFPAAAGEQGVLISEGIDAIAISSAGEAPLEPEADTEKDLDTEALGQYGGAALATVLVLDPLTEPLEHGPDTYVEFSGSLLPGWSIAIFALALLLPAGVAAVDGVARAGRQRHGETRALAWGFGLALGPLAALLLAYLLTLAGLISDPAYPFDPARFEMGIGEIAVCVVLVGAGVAALLVAGVHRPPRRAARDALAPGLGAAATVGGLAVWILNPYLALLLIPAAHAWLLAGRSRPLARPLLALAAPVAVLPAALAANSALGAVGAGAWDAVLMVADRQLPPAELFALCPLLGSLLGLVVLALRPAPPGEDALVRDPS